MNPNLKRFFWRTILSSLVVMAGSIGGIRAVYAGDFWAQQGWIVLTLLGGIAAIWGWWRYKKSN